VLVAAKRGADGGGTAQPKGPQPSLSLAEGSEAFT